MKINNIYCNNGIDGCGKFVEDKGFYRYYCSYTVCTNCIINRSIPKLYMDMEYMRNIK